MKIAFYHRKTWDWSDEDLEGRGIGGTESALVHMARELAKQHEVIVYIPTAKPGLFNGVRYRHVSQLSTDERFDVFIQISNAPLLPRLNSRVNIHWSMEDSETWVESYRHVLPHVDAVFTISPFHARHLRRAFGVPKRKIVTTSCGVPKEAYQKPEPKEQYQLIYCSVPNRGLSELIPIFQLVSKEIPEASLVVTSDFTLWGHRDPGNQSLKAIAVEHPRIRFLGKVPKPELVKLQKTSALHVYPCLVDELCCIASLECQAAGTPTVATRRGALETTVLHGETGWLLDSDPVRDDRFHQLFAETIVDLLKRPQTLRDMSEKARQRALHSFSYETLAAAWTTIFKELMT